MSLRVRNPSPRGLPTLNPQSTCREPRPGPKLMRGVRAGSLRATEPRAREKPAAGREKNADGPKKHIYTYTSCSNIQGTPSRSCEHDRTSIKYYTSKYPGTAPACMIRVATVITVPLCNNGMYHVTCTCGCPTTPDTDILT